MTNSLSNVIRTICLCTHFLNLQRLKGRLRLFAYSLFTEAYVDIFFALKKQFVWQMRIRSRMKKRPQKRGHICKMAATAAATA